MRRASSELISAFEQKVGKTRLVRLKGPSNLTGCNIYGKCEFENPGGSIKDRAALSMILDAEKRGILTRGKKGVIVEGTAGNTGIGLALAASVFGYECVICIANTQSEEKKQTLKNFGAHLVEVPAVPYKNENNYVHVAKRLSTIIGSKTGVDSFYANQWDNHANLMAHYTGTGPEIYEQLEGKIDAFSCAMGTGGTLTGTSRFLKEKNPNIKIALTDPRGSALYRYFKDGELRAEGSSITEGIGQGRVTGNMEGLKPDLLFEIFDEEMLPILYDLQITDGLAVGGSAGTNVAGAIQVAKELGPGHNIVTPLCDLGARYASKLYNPKFMESKGLPIAPWLQPFEKRDPEFAEELQNACSGIIV